MLFKEGLVLKEKKVALKGNAYTSNEDNSCQKCFCLLHSLGSILKGKNLLLRNKSFPFSEDHFSKVTRITKIVSLVEWLWKNGATQENLTWDLLIASQISIWLSYWACIWNIWQMDKLGIKCWLSENLLCPCQFGWKFICSKAEMWFCFVD